MEQTTYGITFVDLHTLAAVKSISIFTLRKYARTENMPHYRVGRKIIVDPIEFDDWFRNRTSLPVDGQSIGDMLDDLLQ